MQTVNSTELQNNFGKYLRYVMQGDEVVIIKNGKEVARIISKEKSSSSLTDSLSGIVKKKK